MAGVCIAAFSKSMFSPSIPSPALQFNTLGGIAHGTAHCRHSTRRYSLDRRSNEYTVTGRWTEGCWECFILVDCVAFLYTKEASLGCGLLLLFNSLPHPDSTPRHPARAFVCNDFHKPTFALHTASLGQMEVCPLAMKGDPVVPVDAVHGV